MIGKLQAAEIFHQLLEHRWFLSERQGRDVPLEEALESYIPDVLEPAPDEQLELGSPTAELFLGDLEAAERRDRVTGVRASTHSDGAEHSDAATVPVP